jgi:hypothetical protein
LTLKAATCCAVAVTSIVVSACGAATARHERVAARPHYLVLRCPKHSVATTDAEAMLKGAWKTIPRVFAIVNRVQGRHEPVSKRNTVVEEVESLDPDNASPRARPFRKAAAKQCGSVTARHSWAITLLFGESVIADTTGVAFVSHTPNGWVIWYAH